MKLNRELRQQIVDEYLNTTRRNSFVAAEFVAWLENHPEHVAYEHFYKDDDQKAAFKYRVRLAQEFVSDLRIVVIRNVAPQQARTRRITIKETEPVPLTLPAMLSTRRDRSNGGGYVHLDPSDPDHMAELYGQAADQLVWWKKRYGDACRMANVDYSIIDSVVAGLRELEGAVSGEEEEA